MNPVEAAWSQTKYTDLANYVPEDVLDLEIEAELAFEATKGKQHLSRSFLHAARLARPVSGDPNRLQQVVWNLLSNAIKFAPKGGRVRVALERVNSHVEVCVSDTGEGISPEVLPHVFERFRQGHGATTRRHGGVGLGLSIGEAPGRTARRDGAVQESGRGPGFDVPVALPHIPLCAENDDGP